jgi:putative RecB family exonuclease
VDRHAGDGPSRELYSHSRLSSFEQCPQKFEYRYILRIPSESESIEGFVGKRVHEVLERLHSFTSRGLVPSLAKVLKRFQLFWDDHWNAERVQIVRSENPVDHYREFGERCLSNYYRSHYPFDADDTVALEERFTFALDEQGSYRMQGIVDRIARAADGAIEIQDYKTSRRMPRQRELDRDRQLALYQIGVARRYGRDQEIRLVWHYLLQNQVCVSTRTPEQLAQLRHGTMQLIDRIRTTTEFPPRPGPLCGWCEYRQRCPAAPRRADEAQETPPIPGDLDGQLAFL